jgi:mannose-1-phosphate guanylyltransferase/mannose-1-phosphate guanylyltransferase/mannose-6-phosphate isomerase
VTRPILPVILCGGAGARLWPVSTEASPKPFASLIGGSSLFEQTVARVTGRAAEAEGFLPPVIVCGQAHQAIVEAQLAAVQITPGVLLVEPCGRGTAPIAAIISTLAAERTPGALVLLLSADHLVPDAAAFRATVRRGAAVADERIVVLGIAPTRPETAYGYIQRGPALADGVHAVARFVEKPPLADAAAYLTSGDHSWNAGVFLFDPALMLREFTLHRPDILAATLGALPAEHAGPLIILDAAFGACPAEALDRAVMEKTDRAAVALCDFAWADVGAWDEVWRLGARDAQGNAVRGDVGLLDVADSLVWSDGPTVAAIGVSDLVIVATQAGVLVAPKARAQEVRALAERLAARAKPDG